MTYAHANIIDDVLCRRQLKIHPCETKFLIVDECLCSDLLRNTSLMITIITLCIGATVEGELYMKND